MKGALPEIGLGEFSDRLRAVAPVELPDDLCATLHSYYLELRRWNRRLSLVGPGTADEAVERHFGESLAALPLVGEGDRVLVDVGSGAGFPGLVLAAARPALEVVLVEARQRKWAFLRSVAARCSLSCVCLNARVGAVLPEGLPTGIDLVTVRAVRLDRDVLAALCGRWSEGGRLLVWSGQSDPEVPEGLVRYRELVLAGSRGRRLLAYRSLRE